MDEIKELLTRGVEKIYPTEKELEKVLRSGKKLRLYQGFDPSMPSLHSGNLVGLMKLRQFQKLGHEVIFLVGDFTGMIGDPSGKSDARKPLSHDQTLENSKKYKEQAGKVLDFEGENAAKLMYNSEWLNKLTFAETAKLASAFTYSQVIERDMFQKRIKEGKDLFLSEFLYPLMQGYDSVAMNVDLELGGSDQLFNMMTGRDLMHKLKNKEKFVMTTKLLVDKDGQKVGKTTGNALFLDSTPENFFGGIMSFPDEVIGLSFELLTEEPLEGIEEEIKRDPMGNKKRLAFTIVKQLWSEAEAQKAKIVFENVFQNRQAPENTLEIELEPKEIEAGELILKTGLVKSMSEVKRLIGSGAVEVNRLPVASHVALITPENDMILKIGKTRFAKIRIKN